MNRARLALERMDVGSNPDESKRLTLGIFYLQNISLLGWDISNLGN